MSLKRSYKGIPVTEIKAFLEEKYLQYNNPSFIECNPILIPHCFRIFFSLPYETRNEKHFANVSGGAEGKG